MDISRLANLYAEKGVSAVNEALKGIPASQKVSLLTELEEYGFEIRWHYSSDTPEGKADGGVVWAGPVID